MPYGVGAHETRISPSCTCAGAPSDSAPVSYIIQPGPSIAKREPRTLPCTARISLGVAQFPYRNEVTKTVRTARYGQTRTPQAGAPPPPPQKPGIINQAGKLPFQPQTPTAASQNATCTRERNPTTTQAPREVSSANPSPSQPQGSFAAFWRVRPLAHLALCCLTDWQAAALRSLFSHLKTFCSASDL